MGDVVGIEGASGSAGTLPSGVDKTSKILRVSRERFLGLGEMVSQKESLRGCVASNQSSSEEETKIKEATVRILSEEARQMPAISHHIGLRSVWK